MRIAHVITRMIIGGAQENTLLNCQDLLRDYGDEVLLVTGPALGPEGDLLTEGRGADLPTLMIPELRRAIHPWRDYRGLRAIRRALADFDPEIVHTHSAKGGFLGRIAANQLRVPGIVHTVHGAPFHEFQGRAARSLFRWCETYAARKCHRLISVADAMTDQLVAAKVAPRDKFKTIYSGMDVHPFLNADQHRQRMRAEFGFEPHHVVVGKIARLFHLKGHEYVIQAAEQVVRQNDHVRFLLVGDGILREQLEAELQRRDLSSYFVFAGLVDPKRVAEMIAAMDVLLHASLREGLARALPQALIAGKPVISYDVDGAREVVLPDQTGFLLEPRSIEPMAQAVLTLAADEPLRTRLGACGREMFTERFRHQTMTRAIRGVYEDLLGQAN